MWVAWKVNPTLDGDMCPPADRIVGTTIILIDATDPWSDIRQAAVAREMAEILSSTPRFQRISVHLVLAGEPPTPAVGALCNPGTPEQIRSDPHGAGLPEWLISHPERVRTRYESAFASVLDGVVSEAAKTPPQARSPIIETLRSAVLTKGQNTPSSIVLISDLYEHSRLCTFYGAATCMGNVERISDPIVGGVHGLSGSEVGVLLLSPAGGDRVPRDDLLAFWLEYFARQGAVVTHVKRIED